MHNSLENLKLIQNKVNELVNKKQLKTDPKIIVVTKTFSLKSIIQEKLFLFLIAWKTSKSYKIIIHSG